MKTQDYIGRYLPDKHYTRGDNYQDTKKCYYCGTIYERGNKCPNCENEETL